MIGVDVRNDEKLEGPDAGERSPCRPVVAAAAEIDEGVMRAGRTAPAEHEQIAIGSRQQG